MSCNFFRKKSVKFCKNSSNLWKNSRKSQKTQGFREKTQGTRVFSLPDTLKKREKKPDIDCISINLTEYQLLDQVVTRVTFFIALNQNSMKWEISRDWGKNFDTLPDCQTGWTCFLHNLRKWTWHSWFHQRSTWIWWPRTVPWPLPDPCTQTEKLTSSFASCNFSGTPPRSQTCSVGCHRSLPRHIRGIVH